MTICSEIRISQESKLQSRFWRANSLPICKSIDLYYKKIIETELEIVINFTLVEIN